MTKIIGGKYRGTSLLVPHGNIVRPTLSSKKETLFNILMSYFLKLNNNKSLNDKIILDAFAGSGSLGLEAVSRGAKYCYFIEKNKLIINILKKNCEKILNKNEFKIINLDYNFLPNKLLKDSIDIVFFDPPYNYKIDKTIFDIIIKKTNKFTVFIIEMSSKNITPEISYLKIIEERIFGKTKIIILTKIKI